jgi:uncharacterized membrane protein YfcA
MLRSDLALYVAVGFVAQIADAALGMANGLLCTSVLLATGVPMPAGGGAVRHRAARRAPL